ncbi:MAG: flippase-like domain-containing protein, partial [Actinomycetota bacterium]|nr:flippase-like domain-containing protein [Actinomycetota bacterium]
TPVSPGVAQKIYGQPLLVRYIPGTVLFVLARVLLAEKAGVPRRISTAGMVYEQALSIAAALTIACYFLIDHPDLGGNPLRWVPLFITPLLVGFLHPRIFGPVSRRVLTALGREPLPNTMSFGGVLLVYVSYFFVWCTMGIGVYFAARSVHFLDVSEIATVAASQMIGFLAAVVSAVTPAGLGVRDAAFAWAVKVALPSGSFGVGAAIAIAVRATQTVVELVYVGVVTLVARRTEGEQHEDLVDLVEEAAGENPG